LVTAAHTTTLREQPHRVDTMRFAWNRATAEEAGEPAPEGASDVVRPAEDDLGTVELLTESGRLTGWIATEGQRTSDWLNALEEVPIHGLVDAEAALPSIADATNGPPALVRRADIIWVVPPPLPPNRHLRLHRRRLLVHLELDEHRISGQVHVRPGADPVDQVLRGTRDLVPLTEAQVVSKADPEQGMLVPVLIVNRRHVRHVAEDMVHASAAVPDPIGVVADGEPLDPRIAWLVATDATTEEQAAGEPGVTDSGTDAPAAEPAAAAAPAADAETLAPPEASGVELLHSALTLLLEAGMIDVVEFQSIRARIPAIPAD
jgi:hypothetical protein